MVQNKNTPPEMQGSDALMQARGHDSVQGIRGRGPFIVVILCLALVVCGICSGDTVTQPQVPHVFYGHVNVEGAMAPAGSTISAMVSGGSGTLVTDTPGLYGSPGATSQKLLVRADSPTGVIPNGAEIHFSVNGTAARCRESGTSVWQNSYPFTSGGFTNLDLEVGQTPQQLVADFSGNPTTGTAPLTVQFTDLSTSQHDQWAWVFGDGGTSTLKNPNHTYDAGTYTVLLTISSGTARGSVEKYHYITVISGTSGGAGGGGGGGGGGGFGVPVSTTTNTTKTVTPTPTSTPVQPSSGGLALGPENKTTKQVTFAATDGIGSLIIGTGVAPVDSSGLPLQQVALNTISAGSLPPGAPCTATPYAYGITPAGSTFTPAVALVLSFDEATWANLKDNRIAIVGYNSSAGTWEEFATETDPGARTVKAMVTKAGTYALCLTPGPEQPPVSMEPTATTPATSPSGLPMDIIIPAILLMVVVLGAIVYLISTRTSNGKNPPKEGQ